jgi:hypothetical protein
VNVISFSDLNLVTVGGTSSSSELGSRMVVRGSDIELTSDILT